MLALAVELGFKLRPPAWYVELFSGIRGKHLPHAWTQLLANVQGQAAEDISNTCTPSNLMGDPNGVPGTSGLGQTQL